MNGNQKLRIFTNEEDLANMQKNRAKIIDKIGQEKYDELVGKLASAIKHKNETIKLVAPEQGARLKETRVKAKLTQSKLAQISGVDRKEISKIERMAQVFSVNSAQKLAEALKVTPQYLIAGEK